MNDWMRRLRACANRRATFRTWHLSEGLNSLLTTAWHIRYSPIGAASKTRRTSREETARPSAHVRDLTAGSRPTSHTCTEASRSRLRRNDAQSLKSLDTLDGRSNGAGDGGRATLVSTAATLLPQGFGLWAEAL